MLNSTHAEGRLKHKKAANYAIFIVIITLLAWLNILLFFFIKDRQARNILFWANNILTVILLLDVLIRWRWIGSAKKYFIEEYGWLDFIGAFPVFSLARAPNVVRTIKALERMGSRRLLRSFISNRGETAVLTITLAIILLFEFASIIILRAERAAPGANIVTANDAMWWVLVTVATVGYGDKYPVTGNGRFIAMFVIVAGIGLFGVLSGYMAQIFLGRKDTPSDAASANLDDILAGIKQIRQEQADIAARLASLEQLLEGTQPEEEK